MTDDDVILAPGELLGGVSRPAVVLPAAPRVTRSAADGLSEAHVAEVILLAEHLGGNVDLITAAFLRAHGNAAESDAVAKWRPHVAKALRGRGGRREP